VLIKKTLEAQQRRCGEFRQEHARDAHAAHAGKALKIDRIAAGGFEMRFTALATHLPAGDATFCPDPTARAVGLTIPWELIFVTIVCGHSPYRQLARMRNLSL
jgi:hypothetical protein